MISDLYLQACLRAAAMFAVSGDQLKQSKASRSGLQLPVGRFLRWMSDVRLGRMIHEYAAIYLTAGIENLLEEILLQCVPTEPHTILTASMLEHAIANSGDLWGLLQPYAHLNAGRTASGLYNHIFFHKEKIYVYLYLQYIPIFDHIHNHDKFRTNLFNFSYSFDI